ncbi:dienelactone hydrolase endo-1,3,1,4-beta-D-glucanase [Crepidotus variabilis]|uniref:Dienelactone hydrolase endo-1,3,1,4-beta-D-glucanase n=1 Tax=Crepidotus variabilis TaxID=179855 RepID=A0A9P6ES39_9AGAR|nr:dienelactone hydrolase endo-1,3,1,4-beta-D-glucanase [Crepidotus variabilis]
MSCPNCQEGFILPGEPTGSIETELLGAYHAPSPSSEPKKYTVLLLTDAFGLPLKNNKLLADKLAQRLECDVWVPDIFAGRPIMPLDTMRLPDRAGVKFPWWKWAQFFLSMLPNIGAVFNATSGKVDKRVEDLISLIKEKKGYEKIGAVGYCFGGSVCTRFAARSDVISSVVIAHPGPFTVEDVKKFTVPAAWACAEDDHYVPVKLQNECEAELASRKGKENYIDYEFKVYPGTAHGFACRPNFEYPDVKDAYEKAFEQTVTWFQKTLPA